jgi:hypothetical protein
MNLRVPPGERAVWVKAAALEGVSLSRWIREACNREVERGKRAARPSRSVRAVLAERRRAADAQARAGQAEPPKVEELPVYGHCGMHPWAPTKRRDPSRCAFGCRLPRMPKL